MTSTPVRIPESKRTVNPESFVLGSEVILSRAERAEIYVQSLVIRPECTDKVARLTEPSI